VNHETMTEVFDGTTHEIAIDATVMVAEMTSVMIATKAGAEDAQAIVLDVMLNPTHDHPTDEMNNVPKRHGVIET
jgi:hypothetical protein